MSILRYATGRGRFVGQSLIYPVPIPLDAAQYFGAAVVGENGQFYYSNGLEWIVPIEDNEILRPSALVPFSVDERTQLRLTTFRSPAGLEQTGTIFEISSNGVDFDGAITRIVPGFGNSYQLEFPEDGFGPGDRVLWRAAYIRTSPRSKTSGRTQTTGSSATGSPVASARCRSRHWCAICASALGCQKAASTSRACTERWKATPSRPSSRRATPSPF